MQIFRCDHRGLAQTLLALNTQLQQQMQATDAALAAIQLDLDRPRRHPAPPAEGARRMFTSRPLRQQ